MDEKVAHGELTIFLFEEMFFNICSLGLRKLWISQLVPITIALLSNISENIEEPVLKHDPFYSDESIDAKSRIMMKGIFVHFKNLMIKKYDSKFLTRTSVFLNFPVKTSLALVERRERELNPSLHSSLRDVVVHSFTLKLNLQANFLQERQFFFSSPKTVCVIRSTKQSIFYQHELHRFKNDTQ